MSVCLCTNRLPEGLGVEEEKICSCTKFHLPASLIDPSEPTVDRRSLLRPALSSSQEIANTL